MLYPYKGWRQDEHFGRTAYNSFERDTSTYDFNSLGFRGEEFDAEAQVKLFVCGCSFTFGIGVELEESWPFLLKQRLAAHRDLAASSVNLLNFSEAGASNDYIARTLIEQSTRVRPDLIVAGFTQPLRFELLDEEMTFRFNPPVLEKYASAGGKFAEMAKRMEFVFLGTDEIQEKVRTIKNMLLLQYFSQSRSSVHIPLLFGEGPGVLALDSDDPPAVRRDRPRPGRAARPHHNGRPRGRRDPSRTALSGIDRRRRLENFRGALLVARCRKGRYPGGPVGARWTGDMSSSTSPPFVDPAIDSGPSRSRFHHGMKAGLGIVIMVAVSVVAAASASAAVPGWQIGAARIDTTPPAYDAAQDLQDFPEASCPRATFDGPRLWRFEEPYTDTDGSGDFNYPGGSPEPFCDYNGNGRWDGIYLSGGIDHLAKFLHDPIDARAVAFSAGGKTVVLESVIAQGIFENYIRDARTQAENLAGQPPHDATCGHIDQMVVSSNHNESSPDTLGLYGAPDAGGFPLHSGIDEYYMDWLDSQMAKVAVAACDQRQAATMRETDFPVPPGIRQEIPNRFPTTNDAGSPRPSTTRSACSRRSTRAAIQSSR